MKIGIIGTGYVGLPTGVGLAELGNEVICIDREPSKIEALQSGKLTIYEDGLEDLDVYKRQSLMFSQRQAKIGKLNDCLCPAIPAVFKIQRYFWTWPPASR